MNLLLDTHTVIWALSNDPTLSQEARTAIIDGNNIVFVSAASAWEIAIKKALGKLKTPSNFEQELKLHRFIPLYISIAHALAVEHLPLHHRDPFDRILIAQAQLEGLTIISRDQRISLYHIPTIKA
jgi:PIN domain nuclease of toxin-antitoxin system